MNKFKKQIDLFLGSEIGKWTETNFDWKLGDVYCSWKSADIDVTSRIKTENQNYAAISIHWPKIFKKEFIEKYKFFFNVHPGFLPFGRGMYPTFWSVVHNSIAGATTHQITEIIDSGPILYREKVDFTENETGEQVWDRVFALEKKQISDLFQLLSQFPSEIPFIYSSEKLGPIRTKSEFERLRISGDTLRLTEYQLHRVKLAFTNSKYELPSWINNQ